MQKRACCIILLVIILLSGCLTGQKEKVYIKDLIVRELNWSEHAISFFVVNENNEIGNCMVRILMNDNLSSTYDVGLINPREKKFFETTVKLDNGETQVKVLPKCELVTEKEAIECNYKNWSERKLCMLTLDKPELKQCLKGDVLYYKFFCIALISKDPGICEYIRSSSKRNWCKAYVTGNPAICNNILEAKDREWCYSDLGINFKDESACSEIKDEKARVSCTAATAQNPDMCLQGTEELKLVCITNIAETTKNKDLCSMLDKKQKLECIEQLKWI